MPTPPNAVPAHWVSHDSEASSPGRAVNPAVIAVAEVLFQTHASQPDRAPLERLDAEVADMRSQISGLGMLVFALGLFAITWVAPLWSFKLPRFARHDAATRAHILERWERSPFGMSLFAVKAILCIVWFEHPDAAAHMNFDGQPLRPSLAPGANTSVLPTPTAVTEGALRG